MKSTTNIEKEGAVHRIKSYRTPSIGDIVIDSNGNKFTCTEIIHVHDILYEISCDTYSKMVSKDIFKTGRMIVK